MAVAQKSATISQTARLKGNVLFRIQCHDKRVRRKILFLYSKCIAYAPDGSEELAYGYSNRSFFLLHLKLYESSITDIDRALEITKSSVLKAKLLCRKIAALKAMNELIPKSIIDEARNLIQFSNVDLEIKSKLEKLLQNSMNMEKDPCNYQYQVPDLPFIDSDIELPATSTAIHMEHEKKFGRLYRATRNISTGEILIIEQGCTVAPNSNHLYVVCSFCLNIAWTGIPCENCPCVFYCSKNCKEAAWDSYHDLECPILRLVFDGDFITCHTVLVLRIFLKGLKEDPNENLDYLLKEFCLANNTEDNRYKGFKHDTFSSENIRSMLSLTTIYEKIKNDIPPSVISLIAVLNNIYGKLYRSSEFYASLQKLNIQDFSDFIKYLFCVTRGNAFLYEVGVNCCCHQNDPHSDDCLSIVGAIIGAASSLTNHSCIPNISILFKQGKIIQFAIRPIKKDEQIFVSYGPSFTDTPQSRQQTLSVHHAFKCGCIACKQQWCIPLMDHKILIQLDQYLGEELLSKIRKIFLQMKNNRAILHDEDMKGIIDELNLKINDMYLKNSLLAVSSVLPMFTDFLPQMYELYYGAGICIPED